MKLSKQKIDRMGEKLHEMLQNLETACAQRLEDLGRKLGYSDIRLARIVQSYYAREAEKLRDSHRAAVRGDMLTRLDERLDDFNMTGTRVESIDSELGRKYVPIQRTKHG